MIWYERLSPWGKDVSFCQSLPPHQQANHIINYMSFLMHFDEPSMSLFSLYMISQYDIICPCPSFINTEKLSFIFPCV